MFVEYTVYFLNVTTSFLGVAFVTFTIVWFVGMGATRSFQAGLLLAGVAALAMGYAATLDIASPSEIKDCIEHVTNVSNKYSEVMYQINLEEYCTTAPEFRTLD
jgi:hypothetical protein